MKASSRILICAALAFATTACAGGVRNAPTGGGGETIIVESNQDAVYYVDGGEAGRGKHLELSVSNGPHVLLTKPKGYAPKELHIRPPYDTDQAYRFYFLVEDQERFQGAPVGAAAAPNPKVAASEDVGLRSIAPRSSGGPGRVWSLAVGVSAYQDASISLKYADRDAIAIDRFFQSERGGKLPDSRRFLFTNETATRANVLSALTSISKRSRPGDMLVLYMAMHGLPDDGGDLYFLTHDTNPKMLVGTGLPQRDVEYALKSAGADRIVMLLDACHAGAAGMGMQKRGIVLAETNRLLAQLAKTKPGLAVLTASSATESSNEGSKWGGGHGVFTHFLLEGLHGLADHDRDGFVGVRELFDYVYDKVSDDTKGEQHPELKGAFDNNMPLGKSR